MYNGVGGRGVGSGGRKGEAGGGLYHPIGLFGVAMSPRTTGYSPRQVCKAYETSH